MSDYAEIFANGVNDESIARAMKVARANIHFRIDCLYAATFFTPEIMKENIYPDPNIEAGLFSKAYKTFMGAKKVKRPDGVEEYKDKSKKKKLRMRHYENGRITSATPQGYENRTDMIDAIINASINQLAHYKDFIQPDQFDRISKIKPLWKE